MVFLQTFPRLFSWRFLFYLPFIILLSFVAFWVYLSTESIPNLIGIDDAKQEMFHYIVVGGGTAGCILASKLSENPAVTVLLIEAGSTFSPLAMVPLMTIQQQKTSVDWQLRTTSQKYSSIGLIDQIQLLPRGKGLGGSSQLNYMLHFDGSEYDFNRWKSYGAYKWDFESLSKGNNFNDGCNTESKTCLKNSNKKKSIYTNNLPTTQLTYDYSALTSKFVDASMILKTKNSPELNYYLTKYNTLDGLRHTTYHSYLKPAFGRDNLKILLGARVHRIVFNNKKNAIGVVVTDENFKIEPQIIKTSREIILSAGAFHSPQLLKLSGVGPSNELKRFKIKVAHSSPSVGRNLYDHLIMPLYVTVNESMSITRSKILNVLEIANYLLHGEGIFSNFGVIGYLNDLHGQYGVGVFGVGAIDDGTLRKIANYDTNSFRQNFPFHNVSNQEGFVLLNICNQPLSRGTVRINSNHIRDAPVIDPNYLENEADIECMIRAIRLSEKLIATDVFRKVNAKIHWPVFDQCKNFADEHSDLNDRYLECVIRVGGVTAHHPGGTCAIGNSSDSVLDNRMRVRGVNKLRVVDASIIPTPVSGNPHTIIAGIGELAAQIILNKM